MISIPFQMNTQYGMYSDALVLPDDHTLTDVDIEAIKAQRVTNWIIAITTPAPEFVEEPIALEPTIVEEASSGI